MQAYHPPSNLWHIGERADVPVEWLQRPPVSAAAPQAAAGRRESVHAPPAYEAASLHTEGFIHCCYPWQLAGVVQRYYRSAQADVLLLELDPAQLGCRLVDENTVGGDELFPHAYGAINHAALLQIYRFNAGDRQRLAGVDAAVASTRSGSDAAAGHPVSDATLKQWLSAQVD